MPSLSFLLTVPVCVCVRTIGDHCGLMLWQGVAEWRPVS